MPLVTWLDKSVSIILFWFRSKYQSTGAVVNITFRYIKAFLYFLSKIKALSFQVRATKGKARTEKLSINHRQKLANPIKAFTSLTFLGFYQFTIALIFFGSICMLFIVIISPRYRTSVLWNLYLSISNYRPAPYRACRIRLTCFLYSARLLLYTKMSSI